MCLFAVLVIAKMLTLAGRDVPLSAWSPFAYFWQDVFVALAFFVVDRRLERAAPAWVAYALLAAYTAINVPVTRVLSTPMTWTMARAARGPLADAVVHYLTAVNLVALAAPAALAIALPLIFRRRAVALWPWGVVPALAIVAVGPFAVTRSRRTACTGTRSVPWSRRASHAWSPSRARPTGGPARSISRVGKISRLYAGP